jgi:hypothetical protein
MLPRVLRKFEGANLEAGAGPPSKWRLAATATAFHAPRRVELEVVNTTWAEATEIGRSGPVGHARQHVDIGRDRQATSTRQMNPRREP